MTMSGLRKYSQGIMAHPDFGSVDFYILIFTGLLGRPPALQIFSAKNI
jgi:hypothetical protein